MATQIATNSSARALYLYGISASRPAPAKVRGGGIDGSSPVENLECSGLRCWISRVDKHEYADQLAGNMENLDWLATTSVRHQRVVGEIASMLTIVPARFGTVFLSEESLQAHVAERQQQILETLRKIEGTEEWGVKLFSVAQVPAQLPPVSSGSDYLRLKAAKLQPVKAKELDPEIKEFIRELQQVTEDSAVSGKVSSGQRNLEWQASFLVRKTKKKEWDAVLRRYATAWQKRREIECTGPWPPYSFI
jgi:hypothetical protein